MIFTNDDNKTNYTSGQINIIKWIFILMMAGIIFGTQVRTDIENLIPFSAIGSFKYIHSFLGIGTLMLTGVLWNKINNSDYNFDKDITVKIISPNPLSYPFFILS